MFTQAPEILNDLTIGSIVVVTTSTPTATATSTPTLTPTPTGEGTATSSPTATPVYTFTPMPSDAPSPGPIYPTSTPTPIPAVVNQIVENVTKQIEKIGDVTTVVTKAVVDVGGPVTIGAVIVGTAVTAIGVSNTLLAVYQATSQSVASLPLDIVNALLQKVLQYISIFFSYFFGFVYKKKQRDGIVFDATTNKPLSNAYIVFFSKSGNIASAFTDKDGTYEAEFSPDSYELRAERSGYIFPSKLITVSSNNLFAHIYRFGEKINITFNNQKISDISIPMDPNLYLSMYRKMTISITHFLGFIFGKISSILAILSIVFSGTALYSDRSLLNIIIFSVLSLLYLMRLISVIYKKNKTKK